MCSHLHAVSPSTTSLHSLINHTATRTVILSRKIWKVDSLTLLLSHFKTTYSRLLLLSIIKARAMQFTSLATCRSIQRSRGQSGPIMSSLMFRSHQKYLKVIMHPQCPLSLSKFVQQLTWRSYHQSVYLLIYSQTITGWLNGVLKVLNMKIFPHGFSLLTRRLIWASNLSSSHRNKIQARQQKYFTFYKMQTLLRLKARHIISKSKWSP